jgi:hypothetical protein
MVVQVLMMVRPVCRKTAAMSSIVSGRERVPRRMLVITSRACASVMVALVRHGNVCRCDGRVCAGERARGTDERSEPG